MSKEQVPLEDRFDMLCEVAAKQAKQIEELEKINQFLGESVIDLGSRVTALCELLVSQETITGEALNHFIDAAEEYLDEQIESVEDEREFRTGPKGDKIYT